MWLAQLTLMRGDIAAHEAKDRVADLGHPQPEAPKPPDTASDAARGPAVAPAVPAPPSRKRGKRKGKR